MKLKDETLIPLLFPIVIAVICAFFLLRCGGQVDNPGENSDCIPGMYAQLPVPCEPVGTAVVVRGTTCLCVDRGGPPVWEAR